MPKTLETMSMVILCFAAPTFYVLRVQFMGSNFNHVDKMKEKS